MNPHLQKILDLVSKSDRVTDQDKAALAKEIKEAEKAIEQQSKTLESQQRELEIEASLEPIRARAMGMQSSDELHDVLCILFQQFDVLGIKPISAFLSLFSSEERTLTYRATGTSGARTQGSQTVEIDSLEVWKEVYNKWKTDTSEAVEVIHYPKEILPKLFDLFEKTFSSMPANERMTPDHFPEGGYTMHGHTRFGYIGYNHTRLPTEEEKEILTKFATEFERVYQRFLDIENAEAQAREAQIETSLERIRARAMGMQKSKELSDVLAVLFQQFDVLGIHPVNVWLSLYNKEDRTFTYRATGTSGKRIHKHQVIDLDAMDIWKESVEQWENGTADEVIVTHYPPEVFPQLLEVFHETFMAMPEKERIHPKDFPDGGYNVQGYCKFGFIGFNHKIPPTEEEKGILKKFATEFERLYQRFLDIEKAEAQAREAQIEAAIEKVRSQSLAMHNTSEMQQVANAVFDQLQNLGLEMDTVGMSGVIEAKQDYDVWVGGAPFGKALRIPYNEKSKVQRDYNKMLKDRPELFARTYSGKVKKEYIDRLLTHGEFPPALRKKMETSDAFTTLIAPKKNSGIQVVRYTDQPFTEQDAEILKRFSKVFEQAYIRFMDLHKAEAQAREAQIEAALERIRAKTMAMHSSEELNDVLRVMFEQIEVLGIDAKCAHLTLMDLENNAFSFRITGKNGAANIGEQIIDLDAMPIWKETVQNWKKAKTHSHQCLVYPPDMLPNLWKLIDESLQSLPAKERIRIKDFPNGVFDCEGHNKFGYIGFNNSRPPTEEEISIVIRFASEFERVYQRFLDIEKAEAHAREAQIELSLESVRAKSMAMQSSHELHEVLSVLFQQFDSLGIKPVNVFLSLFDRDTRTLTYRASGKSGTRIPGKQVVEVDSMEPLKALYDKWLNDNSDDVEVIYYPKEVLPELFGIFADTFASMPDEDRMGPKDFPNGGYSMAGYTPFGYLGYDHQRHATEEEKDILSRFCIEFTRVYQRFLDLQKAEAQTREAQIQLGLERVRARAMEMHNSAELSDASVILYRELKSLGMTQFFNCGYVEVDEPNKIQLGWTSTFEGGETEGYTLPLTGDAVLDERYNSWKNQVPVLRQVVGGSKLLKHFEYVLPQLRSQKVREMTEANFPDPTFFYNCNFKYGYLSLITGEQLDREEEALLERFTRAFELTYSRFLDLKKAEAQAKEAQIETALEKVRSQSLAMHTTSEMQQVANAVYDQLKELGVEMDAVGMSGAIEAKKDYDVWIGGSSFDKPLRIPFNDATQVQRDYNQAIESRSELFARTYSGEIKKEYTDHLLSHGSFPEDLKKRMLKSDAFSTSISFAKNSSIQIARYTGQPYSDQENEILKRFAKVFEQAYIRFMDIEKAEAQAREAQIEAALEKVRSRTMAMHKSQELHKVVLTVSQEIRNLGLNISAAHIYRFEEGDKGINMWIAGDGGIYPYEVYFPYIKHEFFDGVYEARTTNKNFFTLSGTDKKEKNRLYRHLIKSTKIEISEDRQKFALDAKSWTYSVALGKHSGMALLRFTEEEEEEEFSLEDNEILTRFSKVFEQAYIRFMDLQKAEAQARESQIEVALERVRSRAMAMHHTDELTDVLGVLFDQFDFLGINPVLTHLTLFDEENETFTLRIARGGKKQVIAEQRIDVNAVESWKTSFANWKKSDLHALDCIDYPPEVLPAVWEVLNEVMSALPKGQKIFPEDFPNGLYTTQGHCKYGYIGFNHSRRATEEEKEIVIRFAKEFGRLYQRFLDIRKAEIQAREALKQATLDRVRGQIASMRSTEDLERITPLVWNELKALEIPFIRCGVFIIEEANNSVQAFLSTPDGHSLGAMQIPFDADKDTAATVAHWKKGKVYRAHWDKNQFLAFMQNMIDLGQVSDQKQYQGATQPPESLYLHFVPFTQGMLYVGSEATLTEEQIELVQSLADAFAIAYARYEDFSKLEKAKERVETTLSELKATQNQLVQSEKMASLGELTAGIAHEIQNPLNFVNNFSEVSIELITEMLEEIQKGDVVEVKALAEDIIQNLEKINHHGKRADGIVKGMLQHSRASSGEKEPTDLNVLADEYLRLAYHGLRAKDKTFNATLKTHFDASIGKVDLMAQDMGRVILNLITNAFYVVTEKKNAPLPPASKGVVTYEPTVWVSTKRLGTPLGAGGGKVEISVRDNGNGIPDAIKEKIFQPFFTTKPTGQGTGLGLSMSYDIVTKGHGGTLEVKTKEGKGSEFIITLPINQ